MRITEIRTGPARPGCGVRSRTELGISSCQYVGICLLDGRIPLCSMHFERYFVQHVDPLPLTPMELDEKVLVISAEMDKAGG